MGTGEVRNLYGFDDENRIDGGRRPKFNLTCAVEFPILKTIVSWLDLSMMSFATRFTAVQRSCLRMERPGDQYGSTFATI
jgi:hypothetical protein